MTLADFNREVGERVNLARSYKGVTQKEMAHTLGYKNQSTVSYWENGKTALSLYDAVRVAEYLDVSVPWLIATTHRLVERGEHE